jgi:NAD(P) transhydrogenase
MSNPTKKYDLIVIGGGPAGFTAASVAAAAHKSVALIDSHRELGGAGINTGTVPSKTLRETALALSGIRSRSLYGVDLSLRREVTVADFLGHEQHVKAGFNAMLSERLQSRKADVYFGNAVFTDPHTVQVALHAEDGQAEGGEVLLQADHILIATGSSPVRPTLFPFGDTEVYDSDTILKLDRIPKTLAVIGAGVIGSEYGCTFAALGAKVHIIDGRDVLLPFLDDEISKALAAALERSGIAFHWKEKVEACAAEASKEVTLKLSSGATLTVDAVLVAAGRQSNTGALNLPVAGVTTGQRGVITVDKNYQTNVAHIYAAGDVVGFPALASTSIAQARCAVGHALGLESVTPSPLLPNGIYTIPEVSMVGETEESLQKKGVDYVVGRAKYSENARGQIIGDVDGFLKLLFDRREMKLLGVHVLGELATEVVHIGLIAMMAGGGAHLFIEACFNIPTLGALYKSAALDAVQNAAA